MDFIIKQITQGIVFFIHWAERIPHSLVALFARLAIAPVFWFSGRTKVDGFVLQQNTIYQFEHDFGLPFPQLMATLAALGEHILPIMLVLGLGTRFAAAGLFVMTLVIQFVFPMGWWSNHALWFAILLYLVAQGGGRISLDHLIKERMKRAQQ